ncbi:hypothetical protein O1611_g9987 [Lasiodiplodia mahajangana]|uniref:Uncharacterized protein n=1 Tax=Lasiodiplodia mahajangana TaxID=1108764 RepID=A0ACC2J383_9PEZI|nr:hypothetical protein O1611_g9987 [Lasiodiplodia mahajangana]
MAYLVMTSKSPSITRGVQLSRFKGPSPPASPFATYTTPDETKNNSSDDIVPPQSVTTHPLCSGAEKPVDRATKIEMAQRLLNYKFENEDLLWEALQAPGSDVTTLNERLLAQGNKNLASVGDAVITLVIRHHCYNMDRSIGYTALQISALVNNSRFARLCDEAGLTGCINRNPSQSTVEARTRADTIEAIIGAVYQDGGIDSARSVMQSLRITEFAEV